MNGLERKGHIILCLLHKKCKFVPMSIFSHFMISGIYSMSLKKLKKNVHYCAESVVTQFMQLLLM